MRTRVSKGKKKMWQWQGDASGGSNGGSSWRALWSQEEAEGSRGEMRGIEVADVRNAGAYVLE